jgi:hypothetical protein
MSDQTLTRLLNYIDRETSALEGSPNSGVLTLKSEQPLPTARPRVYNDQNFITSLQLHRLSITMDEARSILIDLEQQERHESRSTSGIGTSLEAVRELKRTPSPVSVARSLFAPARKRLKSLNDRLQVIEYTVERQRRAEKTAFQDELKHKEHTQQLGSISNDVKSTLTHRRQSSGDGDPSLLEHHKKSNELRGEMTMEEKLAVQGSVQESLSTEILGFASTLKANAIKMGEKLAADTKLVESAGEALEKVVGGVEKTSTQLNKYTKSDALGWRFYILAVLGVFLSLVFGMTIVWIFPK